MKSASFATLHLRDQNLQCFLRNRPSACAIWKQDVPDILESGKPAVLISLNSSTSSVIGFQWSFSPNFPCTSNKWIWISRISFDTWDSRTFLRRITCGICSARVPATLQVFTPEGAWRWAWCTECCRCAAGKVGEEGEDDLSWRKALERKTIDETWNTPDDSTCFGAQRWQCNSWAKRVVCSFRACEQTVLLRCVSRCGCLVCTTGTSTVVSLYWSSGTSAVLGAEGNHKHLSLQRLQECPECYVRHPPWLVKIFCSSRLSLAAELTEHPDSCSALRFHRTLVSSWDNASLTFTISDHISLDFLSLCYWAVWMTFLFSTISSSKSIFRMVLITSPSFSSCCACWTSASVLGCFGIGRLQLSSVVSLFVLRFVSVAVLRLPCLLLAMLFSCLLLAFLFCLLLTLLFSVLLNIAPDLRCSSRCPRTLVALLHSSRHFLVGCGSVSDPHHLLIGWGSVCDSLSRHWLFGCGSVCVSFSVAGYDSVARFCLLPTPLLGTSRPSWLMVRGRCPRSKGKQGTTTCSAVCEVWSDEVWSEKFFVRQCSPVSLCDTLSCAHLHNEVFHRGILFFEDMRHLRTVQNVLRCDMKDERETRHRKKQAKHHPCWDKRVIKSLSDEESVDLNSVWCNVHRENTMCWREPVVVHDSAKTTFWIPVWTSCRSFLQGSVLLTTNLLGPRFAPIHEVQMKPCFLMATLIGAE